ncbi:uncharacterized protein C8Q71DRAFT_728913 [Rhodofomes roseus]|uniref:Uncharacterized protein n=1 Tax=Rhodofomes roseus TaxID=34475 RepID=A0ABQ8KWG2_9APHY|nr:uncharacterized protein C8Q71DRAFT_728913 [Rhodofomes roseus]KAH9843551.1 hypothetical protein C8Q71DRAFT_728913 [Rhodofomes roseus]
MLLFRSVFIGSPVALAFVAGLAPSVSAAPWWPMHYVMEALPPDTPQSAVTPDASNIASAGATMSSGDLDTMQQTSGASVVHRTGATGVLVGSAFAALYLTF